jgi:hypothetical protein
MNKAENMKNVVGRKPKTTREMEWGMARCKTTDEGLWRRDGEIIYCRR